MRNHRSPRLGLLALTSLPLWIAACGGGGHPSGTLTITSPTDGQVLCDGDDQSTVTPGIQIDVKVSAQGVPDGTVLTLTESGMPTNAMATLTGGVATFTGVTVGPMANDGTFALIASTMDGKVSSSPISVTVNTQAPLLKFSQPLDGTTLGLSLSTCPSTPGDVCYDVVLISTAEDGQLVTLTLTDSAGGKTPQPPVALSGGMAVFKGVTFTSGTWTLDASVTTKCGNPATATVHVTVVTAGPPCTLSVGTVPSVPPTLYPGVLNIATDQDPTTPGEQRDIKITTAASATISLFIDGSAVGTPLTADASGNATFAKTSIPEGSHILTAQCTSAGSLTPASPASVFVDTVAPVCTLMQPKDGAVLNASADIDATMPGVQVNATLTTPATDVDGNPFTVTVNGSASGTTPALAGGTATTEITLNSGPDAVIGGTEDHAANPCSATANVTLDTMGCALQFNDPLSGAVLNQSNDLDTSYATFQYNVTLYVGAKCIGQMASLQVGSGTPMMAAVVSDTNPLGAKVTFPMAQLCSGPCNQSVTLTGSVADTAGTATMATSTVTVDDETPNAQLSISNPMTACGSTVTPASDIDAALAGVQVQAQIATIGGVKSVTLTESNSSGTTTLTAPSPGAFDYFEVTLAPGANSMVGKVVDGAGNPGTATPNPCTINLANIAVSFTNPTSGQTLGASSGTVSGGNLSITVSGAVSQAATVTLMEGTTMLGSNSFAAGAWSFSNVSFSSGPHTIVAQAVAGTNNGSATEMFTVDLSPPAPVASLTVTGPSRSVGRLAWAVPTGTPAVAAYDIRESTLPINAGNFNAATKLSAPTPGAAGSMQTFDVGSLNLGTGYYFAIETISSAGNTSTPTFSTPAPFNPALQSQIENPNTTGTLNGAWTTNPGYFGTPVVAGDFNGDGKVDIAIGGNGFGYTAAADQDGTVQIFLGGASGIPTSPSVVIRGTHAFGNLGNGLAALDFNNDGVTDLVAGDYTTGGGLVIFFGSSTRFTSSVLMDTDADIVVNADYASYVGAPITASDVDGDGVQDIVVGAPLDGASATGAGYVLYGGSGTKPSSPITTGIPSGMLCTSSTSCGPLVGWRYGFDKAAANSWYGLTATVFGHPTAASTKQMLALGSTTGVVEAFVGIAPPTTSQRLCTTSAANPAPCITIADSAAKFVVVSETGASLTLGGLHDQNGDGADELVLGDSTYSSNTGRAYIVDGATTGGTTAAPLGVATAASTIITGSAGSFLGLGIAWLPPKAGTYFDDMNGDGRGDLLIMGDKNAYLFYAGTTAFPASMSSASASYVVAPLAGSTDPQYINNIGDVSGDKLPDFATGDAHNGPGRAVLYW